MGVKEYELPNGRKAVFEFDENGVGKITLEAVDLLMGLIKADLVRCGECKHAKYKIEDAESVKCMITQLFVSKSDFCSYGERGEWYGSNKSRTS